MDKLPNEILHEIFIRVPFEWKLECVLVCHRWCTILRNHSLFFDVKITGEKMYRKFRDMIQHLPSRGDQVEIFDLNVKSTYRFEYQEFYDMLPNLRQLNFENRDFSIEEIDSGPLERVNSKLEVIKETFDCGLTQWLLMSCTCTRLKSLELEFNCIGNPGKKLFAYLKNAPALEELTLYHSKIGIEDCEVLHHSLPALKAFYLKRSVLKAGELPLHIIPATSVESFSMNIHIVRDHATYPNWYEYLAKKYTSLTDFEFEDTNIRNTDTDGATKIYQNGLLVIYKNMGKQLNTFKATSVPPHLNIFNELSMSGVRFNTFFFEYNESTSLFTELAESDLSTYAKNITLESTIISSPIMLQNFTSLRTLSIELNGTSSYWDANLTDYFNGFPPTLTSFDGYFGNAKISELPTNPNNIEEFHLHCDVICPKLGEAISNCFPKLKNLHLQGIIAEDLSINLPKNDFQEIYIRTCFHGDISNAFTVTSSKKSQPQYFINQHKESEYPNVIPATAEDLQNRVNINIRYNTADRTGYYTLYRPRERSL